MDRVISLLTRDRATTALLMDFDGSLSEIVEHPDDAVPRPEVVALLRALVERFGRVGIVSGRPVDFLRSRLPVDGLELVGQYGLERWREGRIEVDARVEPFAARLAAVADRAEVELPDVYVERKGRVAVGLHWRADPAAGGRGSQWAAETAAATGLVAHPARMTVELRPPIDVDKGHAVALLASGWRVASFAGDDFGDLVAFAALDDLVARGELEAAVRVGVRSAEEPAELAAATDVLVDGPRGLVELLSALVGPD
ncbi:MAG: trehalose-phosphatase [Acidimicrobiia bacterium]